MNTKTSTDRAYNDITLGIFAGGQATRLGCSDKAWAIYRGEPLIQRTLNAFGEAFAARLVSANRDLERYVSLDLRAVPDRIADYPGPLAGLDALLAVCETPLLLTAPVDVRTFPSDLLARLTVTGESGAVAQDGKGLQPLVALWPVARARVVVGRAISRGERAVHRIVAELDLPVVHFADADFGNLNTPDDFLT